MNPEKMTNRESMEAYSSKIELRFLRHEEKEKIKGIPDTEVPITAAGRERAKSLAEDMGDEGLSQSIAFGSPRKRSRETAALAMSGKEEGVTGEESLEDLQAKLDSELEYGSKINIDSRLDFNLDDNSVYGQRANAEYMAGRLLRFMVNESDDLARELGDKESSTYSRQAGAIASIIEKYIQMAPRWDKLVNDPAKDYETDLKRFFGTHQTIPECFLAKVIEATKGTKLRDAFVDSLKGQGVGFGEGFKVDIVTAEEGEKPKVMVRYKKEGSKPEESFEFDEEVSEDLIKALMEGMANNEL